jgi:ActR/RegA family two-component response regulator
MKRVLVLDDDDDLCQVMQRLFLSLGARECATAHSLSEIQRMDFRGFDLAVLDVNLGAGEPNGLKVYEWLLSQNFGGRIVFLTGHAQSHPLVQQVMQIAGSHVMEKPASIQQIAALLK